MLRLVKVALICALSAMAQSLPQIAEGDWTFHVSGASDFPIRIARTSDANFTGAYAGTVIMNGKTVAPSGGLNLMISWFYVSPNIPGSGWETYFGLLASDGKSASGTYGVSPSQSSGTWSALLNAAPAPPTTATTGCDAKSFNGAFSFLLTGYIQSDSGTVSVHVLGRMTVDGAGALAASETASAGGIILSRSISGKYSVSPECIASIQVTDGAGAQSNFNAIISAGGKTVQFIQTDAGTVVSGTAFQQ